MAQQDLIILESSKKILGIEYVPLPKEKRVVVYYAGKHPVKKKYPHPPNI